MPSHSALTGSDLHEPKGVAAATSGQVYAANGAGSGTWKKVTSSEIDSTIKNINKGVISGFIPDISSGTANQNRTYIVLPYNCTVVKVHTVIAGANATADNTLTVRNNAGTSMGTITVAFSGSAAGDVDTLTPGSNNTFTAGEKILIESDGAGTNTVPCTVTIEFTYT